MRHIQGAPDPEGTMRASILAFLRRQRLIDGHTGHLVVPQAKQKDDPMDRDNSLDSGESVYREGLLLPPSFFEKQGNEDMGISPQKREGISRIWLEKLQREPLDLKRKEREPEQKSAEGRDADILAFPRLFLQKRECDDRFVSDSHIPDNHISDYQGTGNLLPGLASETDVSAHLAPLFPPSFSSPDPASGFTERQDGMGAQTQGNAFEAVTDKASLISPPHLSSLFALRLKAGDLDPGEMISSQDRSAQGGSPHVLNELLQVQKADRGDEREKQQVAVADKADRIPPTELSSHGGEPKGQSGELKALSGEPKVPAKMEEKEESLIQAIHMEKMRAEAVKVIAAWILDEVKKINERAIGDEKRAETGKEPVSSGEEEEDQYTAEDRVNGRQLSSSSYQRMKAWNPWSMK
ncbi:MAG: hypothetical protein PSN37_04840 [Alphaproteobacteria bacterium]|nr:hypothetical protein [Alphaproteobacteria bacterium]